METYLRTVRASAAKAALKTWATEGYLCSTTKVPQPPYPDGEPAIQYTLTPIAGATTEEPSVFDV